MIEEFKTVFGISMALAPFLSVVIILVKRFFFFFFSYFEQGVLILAEVDDIIDSILMKFPENDYLNTIDDVLDKLLEELEQAGYQVSDKDVKKMEYRLKSKINQGAGFKLDLDPVGEEYRVKYEGEF